VRCDEWMVRMSEWFGIREDLYYILTLLHVLGMQTTAKQIRITRPLYFLFSAKAHWY
jgi:hypothetical protein